MGNESNKDPKSDREERAALPANGSGSLKPGDVRQRLEAARLRLLDAAAGDSLVPDEDAKGWQERDSPSEREIRDLEFDQRGTTRHRLREIEEALSRLASGTYGRCAECATPIDPRRLANDPAVALCRDCQAEREGTVVPARL